MSPYQPRDKLSGANLPNIFLGGELIPHEYKFLEEIYMKIKQLLKSYNFLSSILGIVGVKALESPKAIAVSATQPIPKPQTKLKKAIQGDTKLAENSRAKMHHTA